MAALDGQGMASSLPHVASIRERFRSLARATKIDDFTKRRAASSSWGLLDSKRPRLVYIRARARRDDCGAFELELPQSEQERWLASRRGRQELVQPAAPGRAPEPVRLVAEGCLEPGLPSLFRDVGLGIVLSGRADATGSADSALLRWLSGTLHEGLDPVLALHAQELVHSWAWVGYEEWRLLADHSANREVEAARDHLDRKGARRAAVALPGSWLVARMRELATAR